MFGLSTRPINCFRFENGTGRCALSVRSFLDQWIENRTRIDEVIHETVKKTRNFGHFFDLARDFATTYQHISHTIACGKGVFYMYLQTCKAALASCFIKSVIDTVLCRNFPIFHTFSPTGSPVRYLPFTNRKF